MVAAAAGARAMIERALSPDEQVLARATKRAVETAGGLAICERETGVSDSQLSRCCSPNHRDSLTIRDAVAIDGIGHGKAGHPHLLRAMARVIGGVVVIPMPDAGHDPSCLMQSIMEVTAELGDVSRSVVESLHPDSIGGETMTAAEVAISLEHLDRLNEASAKLRLKLQRAGNTQAPG